MRSLAVAILYLDVLQEACWRPLEQGCSILLYLNLDRWAIGCLSDREAVADLDTDMIGILFAAFLGACWEDVHASDAFLHILDDLGSQTARAVGGFLSLLSSESIDDREA